MLGRLARWLRILGYDTLYDPSLDDMALLKTARADDRMLLTQDVALSRRRGARTLYVPSHEPLQQLRQVIADLRLRPSRAYSRCSVCNTALVDATPEEIARHVPAYVRRTYTLFRRCLQCGHVYWHGSHWRDMQRALGIAPAPPDDGTR